MTRTLLRTLLAVVVVSLGGIAVATGAEAHPFGPPPVAKVVADGAEVVVTWSAADDDLIALGVRTRALPGSSADQQDPAVRAAVANSTAVRDYLRNNLSVAQGNQACPLRSATTAALWDGGARLEFTCTTSPVTTVSLRITALTDINPAYRTISVSAIGSGALHTATAPVHAIELVAAAKAPESTSTGPVWTMDLPALLDRGPALALMLLVSALVGAAHACAPGHGKTLAAGYLVGGQGKARDAVWLGLIVAVMHTLSVAVLGVGWWIATDRAPDLAAVTGWLQLAGSLLVFAVGVALVRRHLRNRRSPQAAQPHSHGHGHGHVVLEPETLLTRRGLVLLGTSGGLLPSPSAFLVLVAGLLTGRVVTAVLMVVAFGIGMALTLTGVGLAVLRGRDALVRRATGSSRLRRLSLQLPLVAAGLVVLGGSIASVLAAVNVIT